MSDANRLICNGCLEPIELGRSFTWYMTKPYHNHCAVNQPLITRAEADAMVAAERERCAQMANAQAQVFRDEAHDQKQLGSREMHKRALMIASFFDAHAVAIRALPLPEPTEARVKAAAPYISTVQNVDPGRCLNPFDDLITALGFNENQSTMNDEPTEALVAAERALWVQAIETYFDATAVMDVEKYVERLRAEGKGVSA